MNRFIGFLVSSLLLAGCQTYLDELPQKQTRIETADQLDALLNPVSLTWEPNLSAVYSSDDTEISRELYSAAPTNFRLVNMSYYTFGTDPIIVEATDALWQGEYNKIYIANLILETLDKVSGSNEQKAQLRADAYFFRAYSFWVLANNYCLPYSTQNLGEPGLPLKKTTSFEESLVRSSLGETYAQIEQDLLEAQKTGVDDVQDRLRWRNSKKGVAAFMSRFYLFMGNYDKAITAADEALASQSVKLVDYKTIIAGTPVAYTNPAVTLRYADWNTWTATRYLYFPEMYYARFIRNTAQWFTPSSALLATYEGTNDLRFRWLFIPNGNRRFGINSPATYRYTIFSDGTYLPNGPTRPEVMLTKAEALARKGNTADALSLVNQLRTSRLQAPSALTATTPVEALQQTLAERRRELPFTMRWYDVRRFGVNETATDDVEVTRDFFDVSRSAVNINAPRTYRLSVGSRRYAQPINGIELNAARGQLSQNNY